MNGEVGRFAFAVFQPKESPCGLFAAQVGKSCYSTRGFKEIALFEGAAEGSYRQVCQRLNRQWRQPDAIGPGSLQAEVQQEGRGFDADMERWANGVLQCNGFDAQAQPVAGQELRPGPWQALEEAPLEQARQELINEAPESLQTALSGQELLKEQYEVKEQTAYCSVDDVWSKRQKAHRQKKGKPRTVGGGPAPAPQPAAEGELKFVHNSCARVQFMGNTYTLVAKGLGQLLVWLAGLLLGNRLLDCNWLFMVDGERSIRNAIVETFAWRSIRLLLDWFHVKKKCQTQLSMAINNKERRNQVLLELLPFLWYGLLDKAIQYLQSLNPAWIKNKAELEKLADYFDRHRNAIPNYALRKKLGLPNSNNPVEKANDELVAQRQKNNGMSWSDNGSTHLAKVIAINVNGERNNWLRSGKLTFRLRKEAA